MFHDYLRGSLEALLFAAGEPLSVAKLAEIMQLDKLRYGNSYRF